MEQLIKDDAYFTKKEIKEIKKFNRAFKQSGLEKTLIDFMAEQRKITQGLLDKNQKFEEAVKKTIEDLEGQIATNESKSVADILGEYLNGKGDDK
jgi:dipeptidase